MFKYVTTFSLSGILAGSARITGDVAADNVLTGIKLNGTPVAVPANGFSSLAPLTISKGFVAGTNTHT